MYLLTFLFRVLFGLAIVDQNPINFWKHSVWTSEDGLLMNSVTSMAQTQDGYIWLGTENGLVRFDGIDFDVISIENMQSIQTKSIVSLLVDKTGHLWIGTYGGGVARLEKDAAKTYTTQHGLLSNEVLHLFQSRDRTIWIGTRKGLYRYHEERLINVPLVGKNDLPIGSICEDKIGRLWVGAKGNGLYLVHKKINKFESKYKGFAGMNINDLLIDRTNNLWIATFGSGLFKMNIDHIEQKQMYNLKTGFATNNIDCLLEDHAGDIWIGTFGNGIFIHRNTKNNFVSFNDQNGLSNNEVISLFQDRENIIWIGTEGGGLNNLFESRIYTITKKHGLSSNNVTGVFQDSQENIWIGNRGYSFDVYDVKTGNIQSIQSKYDFSILGWGAIAEYPKGEIWFDYLDRGVGRFSLENKELKYFSKSEGIPDGLIRALYVDAQNQLWAGTDKGGLYVFSNEHFALFTNIGSRIITILKDRNQALWIGTMGGGLYHFKDGKMITYNKNNGLSDSIVVSIYEDTNGTIWVGTISGLSVFHHGYLHKITKKHGLADSTICCILEDGNHVMWMSSNRGIYAIDRNDLIALIEKKQDSISPSLYSIEDGMKSIECNGGIQPACLKATDGKLWFPTTRGVSIVDPDRMVLDSFLPSVLIKQFMMDGKSYPLGKTAYVPPGRGDLEISYAGIGFVAPTRIRYKYKIEGLHNEWVDNGKRRSINIVSMAPGTYRFRVIASCEDGEWNMHDASFEFVFIAKFYHTLFFKIGAFLVIICILIILIHLSHKYHLQNKLKNKYKGSRLGQNEINIYQHKIINIVEIDHDYKDPELSVSSLAKKMSVHPNVVSQVINVGIGKNFKEFVNQYRVKEAQRLMLLPENHDKPILDIAFEVGFNSKNSFNRVFKQLTNMTPTQFIKSNNKVNS